MNAAGAERVDASGKIVLSGSVNVYGAKVHPGSLIVLSQAGPKSGCKLQPLRDLMSLGLEVIPAEILADEALMIALAHKITAYDACYVALAARLQLPLLTADAQLVAKFEKAPYEVQWLGDMPSLSMPPIK